MNISGARGSEASARRFRRDGAVKQISIAISTFGYDIFGEAMAIQNGVPQGLSSWIFTLNLREADAFLSATVSDCGIANLNLGPPGAEIIGAFEGEKETGGGRHAAILLSMAVTPPFAQSGKAAST